MDSQEQGDIVCDECGNQPDNYVRLDCDHKFCLICLSYHSLQLSQQQPQYFGQIPQTAVCPKCAQVTQLDQEPIEAIHYIIQNIIIPMIEKQEQEQHQYISEEQKEQQIEETAQIEHVENIHFSDSQIEISGLDADIINQQYEIKQSSSFNKLRNEKIVNFMERLEKNLQYKVEQIKEIQGQKKQFQQKCQTIKEDVNQQFQAQIRQLETRRNNILGELQSLEMIQLLEIQKFEKDLQQQIESIQKHTQELQSLQHKNLQNEELNHYLLDIERQLNTGSLNLNFKTNLINAQRQILNVSNRLFSPEKNITKQPMNTSEKPPLSNTYPAQTSNKTAAKVSFSPILKNEKSADIWQQINESDKKSLGKESQMDSSQKQQKWKDLLLGVFDQKSEQRQEEQQQIAQQDYYNTQYNTQTKAYNNSFQRNYTIHEVLNLQKQNFMQQKESLLRR